MARKDYEAWEVERIRMAADVELFKLVKIEEQEVPKFDVGACLKDFTAKKKKECLAERKRRKILMGLTVLQQRKEYE